MTADRRHHRMRDIGPSPLGRAPRWAFVLAALPLLAAVAVAQEAGGHQVWVEDASGGALDAFHEALGRAERGEGRARIAVWGASHVASDQFTGFLRRSLQARFGDAGPGVVLPARAFSLYEHSLARVEDDERWTALRINGRHRDEGAYGIANIAVEAPGGARSRVVLDPGVRPVDRAIVYYLRQAGGGRVRLEGGDRRRTLSTGSAGSTMPGYAVLEREGGVREVGIRSLGGGPVRLFGVSFERDAPGVIVDAMGVPGARIRDRLPNDARIQRSNMRRLAPDLVVLAYGTNETGFRGRPMARYRRELREAIQRARRSAPDASCLLIGPSDWPVRGEDGTRGPRERTGLVIEAQRAAARRHGCGFFDLVGFMGGPGSMARFVAAVPPLAHTDYVHFTDGGHRQLAAILERALLRGYAASPSPHVQPSRAQRR